MRDPEIEPEIEREPEPDVADPLKRDPEREEESIPGLDPAITIPPEE